LLSWKPLLFGIKNEILVNAGQFGFFWGIHRLYDYFFRRIKIFVRFARLSTIGGLSTPNNQQALFERWVIIGRICHGKTHVCAD
jgi:hypothetical protein